VVATAAGCIAAAGLIHLVAAPVFWQHAAAEGWFLALAGLVELVWGSLFWLRPSTQSFRTGVVIAGAMITLYVATRVLPAPFDSLPEPVDLYGILAKLAEALGLVALYALVLVGARARHPGHSITAAFGDWLIVGFTVGLLIYGGADGVGTFLKAAPLPAPTPNALTGTPTEPVRSAVDRVQLLVSGAPRQNANLSAIPVTGNLVAALAISAPTGDSRARTLDLRLYRGDELDQPVDDAKVTMSVAMQGMEDMRVDAVAVHQADGHYVLTLPYVMPGDWEVDLSIATPREQGTMRLDWSVAR